MSSAAMNGAASATASVIKDHSAAVGQYFGSVRVPASFLVGASFTGLFSVKTGDDDNIPRIDLMLRSIYHLAIAFSFFMAINVVLICTAGLTKNLAGGFDPMAASGYRLLNREFHYEFVVTRWSFFVSLFSFLVAVTSRILYEYKLFSTKGKLAVRRKRIGLAVCLWMSALLFHLIAFINSTLYCWNNLWGMTLELIKVSRRIQTFYL